MEFSIPIHFLIYAGCLLGACITTYSIGIRVGIVSAVTQLEEQGLISFEEEDID